MADDPVWVLHLDREEMGHLRRLLFHEAKRLQKRREKLVAKYGPEATNLPDLDRHQQVNYRLHRMVQRGPHRG